MHPVTPITTSGFVSRSCWSWPTRPITRCSAWSRMAQVFTRITSASSADAAGAYPCSARMPAISSLSLMFIWQPYVSM